MLEPLLTPRSLLTLCLAVSLAFSVLLALATEHMHQALLFRPASWQEWVLQVITPGLIVVLWVLVIVR